jgi:hypothetical protein
MKIVNLLSIQDENELFEMSNIVPRRTGLAVSIWVREKNEGLQHACSVKVSNIPGRFDPNDNFSVSVSGSPRVIAGKCKLKSQVLEDIIDWVKLNKEALLDLWESRIDIGDFLESVKKI